MIFETLCAIQELLYLKDNKRTAESVLALYGKTFLHGILLRKHIGHNVKKLTAKKLYGKYFHSLFRHSADEHSLLSGKSMNAKNQERTLRFLKDITSGTSNHHPDQILLNCVIRSQATKKLNACSASEAIESKISKAAKTLDIQRTTVPIEIIEKYPNEYQSHLERIADFLLYQQTTASRPIFWKETNEGVMFNDNYIDDYSLKPTSDFRYKSLSDELSFVAHCLTNCLKFLNNYIPAFKIKTEENAGTLKTSQLSTLEYFTKRKRISSKGESSVTRDQSNSLSITNVILTQDNMPISLTIDNSLSETVNLIEFSTPRKTPSNQSNYEKKSFKKTFQVSISKTQKFSLVLQYASNTTHQHNINLHQMIQ